jgi:hypothetical protein
LAAGGCYKKHFPWQVLGAASPYQLLVIFVLFIADCNMRIGSSAIINFDKINQKCLYSLSRVF